MVKKGILQKLFRFKDGDRAAVEKFVSSLGIDTSQKEFQETLDGIFGEEKMIDDAVDQAVIKEASHDNTEEIPTEEIIRAEKMSSEDFSESEVDSE